MMTAVFIDDEIDTDRESIKADWLRHHGVRVIPVRWIRDALPVIRENRRLIDVVLLDILMPPLDLYTLEETGDGTDTGLRLLQDIRDEFPKLPVIIVSVKPPVEVAPLLETHRVNGYLYKPVLGIDILEEISRVVRRG